VKKGNARKGIVPMSQSGQRARILLTREDREGRGQRGAGAGGMQRSQFAKKNLPPLSSRNCEFSRKGGRRVRRGLGVIELQGQRKHDKLGVKGSKSTGGTGD